MTHSFLSAKSCLGDGESRRMKATYLHHGADQEVAPKEVSQPTGQDGALAVTRSDCGAS
jgi:hypothetical protein